PRALTLAEIAAIPSLFAAAALRTKTAGFDAVEIHSAHGYLLNQFFSPLLNHRTDEYGGDVHGRIKLHLEVIAAAAFEAAGVDMLDITGGIYGYLRPGHTEPGYYAELSEAIKGVVTIPVILTGGVTEPEQAESLLADGKADLIGVGRAILADSGWALLAEERA
ncbi:MAG: NADH:flavin oxidoreductase, partial [Actinomycetota bacterium]|nr:NADH:flavin oxidoreductase [Actinomycetota bacterium]